MLTAEQPDRWGEAMNSPAGQLIYEAIMKGLDKVPEGRELREECARRRRDVRDTLKHLAQSLSKMEAQIRSQSHSNEKLNPRFKELYAKRVQWVFDRCCGLIYALDVLRVHDRKETYRSTESASLSCFERDQALAQEYALLRADVEAQQDHALRIIAELEGTTYSDGIQSMFVLLASPFNALGTSLTYCASSIGGGLVQCANIRSAVDTSPRKSLSRS